MKVLLFPAYFKPELMASSLLDEELNCAFTNAGIKLEVYTPTPTRGITTEVRKEYKKKRQESFYNDTMKVHRFKMFREGKNPLLRALRYFLILIKQYFWGLKSKDIDLMFVSSTPPINGLLAGPLKKIKKIPYIYNLQDVFPDSLSTLGVKSSSIIWKIGAKIERYTYLHADKIIVISEDIKRNIIAKGVPEDKIELIYNWVDEKAVHPIEKEDNPLFEEFKICRDKFNIVYAGNLGNAQNIQILIDSAERLAKYSDIEFIIFGTGGLEVEIKQQIQTKKMKNIRIFPLQPLERVSYVYGLGDVCVVSCKEGLGGSAMPSKSVTIMATGRPLLVNFDKGELEQIVAKNKCGLFSEAGKLDQFIESILAFYENREMCEEYGRNARNLILDKFTKETNVQKYVNVVKFYENY